MRKKVIFMIINMNIGGTEKALLNMIDTMPEEKFDITILMLEKYGGFLSFIPERIHVAYVREYPVLKGMLNDPAKVALIRLFKEGHIKKAFTFLFVTVISKMFKDKCIFFKYITAQIPTYKNNYDVAVAYAGPMDFISYFVVHKMMAKKKMQWIHFDVEKIGFDTRFAAKLYRKFDSIYTVSHEGKSKLIGKLPILEAKIHPVTNRISSKMIREMAKKGDGFVDHFTGIRILTVGRLSKEKGQDMIIPVLATLKTEGFHVRWYCIGEGIARVEYEALIKQYNIENDFLLLGEKVNPYPYMEQCDIYVQPSRHEGYCLTLAEARCFNRPIISTNFTGVNEHIVHGETGTIVHVDGKELYTALKRCILGELLQKKWRKPVNEKAGGYS